MVLAFARREIDYVVAIEFFLTHQLELQAFVIPGCAERQPEWFDIPRRDERLGKRGWMESPGSSHSFSVP